MSMKSFLFGAGLGAALAHFLDPDNGARRRSTTRDQAAAKLRRTARSGEGAMEAASAQAEALKQKATHLQEEPKPQPDDVTLARKVESEIFRDADAPKGKVAVNAEDGVVYLRGEVESAQTITALVEATGKVEGVRGVENLLHLPGEEPKHKEEPAAKAS